ncbi:GNAT family N-acetyltransferase [Streptomyces sp. NPDC017979]|uniref:GNAT family N-acetyltransferase n=1 Tax=Streptomyces sp. NPDC017979 TaxID=3365024 RepID=UPI0037A7CA33
MPDDPHLLRPVTDEEFPAWARLIGDTCGSDYTDEKLDRLRPLVELDRTIGAFDTSDTFGASGAFAAGRPVGGTAAYSRVMTVPGGSLPVAGVTWVGVAATHRRRGLLTAMMRRQLTEVYEGGGESIAALRPSEAAIYGRYGYGPATRGARLRCAKKELRFLPGTDFGTGRVLLLPPDEARPLIEEAYERARVRTPGWPDRAARFWDFRLLDEPGERGGGTALRYAVHHEPDGTVTGYALYRFASDEEVRVEELAATSRQAYAALWRYLAGIDLVSTITYEGAVDETLPHLLVDPRAVESSEVDRLWVRLVDVRRALAGRRYAVPAGTELDVVLDVADDFCPWNTGRYRLRADGDDVSCERLAGGAGAADLSLTAAELGAAFLGGSTLAALAAAGRVTELRPGALARTSAAFKGEREPHYPCGTAFPAY